MGAAAGVGVSAAIQSVESSDLQEVFSSLPAEAQTKLAQSIPKGGTSTSSSIKPKLHYLDARGRAELSRVMFTATATPFEDVRYPISFLNEPPFVEMAEFNAAKAAGELAAGMGQAPILDVGGKKIGQSRAVERYVARATGLMGSDDIEAAQIDQLGETVRDIGMMCDRCFSGFPPKCDNDALNKLFSEKLPETLKKAEASMPPAVDGPWVVGSKMSYADVAFFVLLATKGGVVEQDPFLQNPEGCKQSYQECPRIKASIEAVDAIPAVKEYLANRKVTER